MLNYRICMFFNHSNNLTQSPTRWLPLPVPLRDLSRELIAKTRKLLNAIVDRSEVTVREVEHVRTRRSARAAQFQNLPDLVEREPERLRFLDEPQLFDCRFAVAAITGR